MNATEVASRCRRAPDPAAIALGVQATAGVQSVLAGGGSYSLLASGEARAIAQRWFSPPAPGEQPHRALPPEPSEILIGDAA
ncbi:MAG: hypothetical protein ABR946_07520 [Solirubrobacteraceae bacterium]|jgi:hypothetical protein